jgi:TetR/AcrR family transcriptional repressor of nem operon
MDTTLHTRDKIVELGRGYIQQIGYHAFNYKQVATTLNIKNAAVHHYYPSKEDLGLAVIEKDKHDFNYMTKYVENASPMEKLEALLNNYNQYFHDKNKLCIIGTFGSAYHDIPPKIQMAIAQYLDTVITWLTETIQSGLDSGQFNFKGTAEEMANAWTATLPGILQIGRIRGTVYFDQMLEHLRKSLKTG